ncbi:MAG: S41 family peptidase [Mariprofundaceae bacterium]|nr:S41 family peptidase [Mariprofundaceae bacterium]
MNKTRWTLLAATLIVAVTAVVAWSPSLSYQEATAATDFKQLDKFAQVLSAVKRIYVKEKSDEELIDGALSGMLASLDPHSTYMNKEMFKQMQVETNGRFGGLGIEISHAEGGIRIISPIEDTPAWRAGIKAGDLIIKIDDALARDLTLPEAVSIMRGEPGTSITLTIFRETETRPLEIKLVRAIIKVKSVKGGMLSPGYAWLRLSQFRLNAADELKKQIADLEKENGGPLEGVVFDLRNNPGGLLDQAAAVSDLFLESGDIVSTKSRVGKNTIFSAEAGDAIHGKPLIVLINRGSASASEIVSGALQDNQRAVIMGEKSFGKGSVQRIIPLPDGTAIKLTTSLYYTPNGRSIQATGIVPDVKVVQQIIKAGKDKEPSFNISERDHKGHLENANGKKAVKKSMSKVSESTNTVTELLKKRLKMDTQLQRAFDVLKAMHVLDARQNKQGGA